MIELGNLHFEESKRGFYVDAILFDTKEEMHNFITRHGSKPLDCLAMSLGYTTINTKGNYTKRLGTLVFYKGFMGAGVVAHECGHACFNYARTKRRCNFDEQGGDIDDDADEEFYLHALTRLVVQFWEKYYEHCPDDNPSPEAD